LSQVGLALSMMEYKALEKAREEEGRLVEEQLKTMKMERLISREDAILLA